MTTANAQIKLTNNPTNGSIEQAATSHRRFLSLSAAMIAGIERVLAMLPPHQGTEALAGLGETGERQ